VETGYVLRKFMPRASLKLLLDTGHVPMLSNKEFFLNLLIANLNNKEMPSHPLITTRYQAIVL